MTTGGISETWSANRTPNRLQTRSFLFGCRSALTRGMSPAAVVPVPTEKPRAFGEPVLAMLTWTGDLVLFCWRVARALVTPPFERAEFFRQLDAVGAKSLPLACLAGAATGVVLSLQTRDSLTRFGQVFAASRDRLLAAERDRAYHCQPHRLRPRGRRESARS